MKVVSWLKVLALGAVLALLVAQAAGADVFKVAEGALEVWVCDQDGSKHPRRIDVYQVVSSDFFASRSRLEFNFLYAMEREEASRGARAAGAGSGRVTAAVRLFRADGSEANLGKLRARVRPDGADLEAEGAKRLKARLEEGDVLRWRFTFKGLPVMNAGDLIWLETAPVLPDL